MTSMKIVRDVTGPTLTIDLPPEFKNQQVEVEVRLLEKKQPWGEGLNRSAGIMADEATFGPVMDEIQQERKRERRPLPEDE
jgi:hypothetical protein